MHEIGSILLGEIINADGGAYKGRYISKEDGGAYEFVDYRDKDVLSALGQVKVKRAYYYDNKSGEGFCPKDKALDIEGTSYSPGVRRMMSKVGAYRSFGLGHEDLYELAGIRVNAKEVERVSEMVGRQIEAFHAAQAEAALSDKIIQIKSIPKMYVCMDGFGVPMVKKRPQGDRARERTVRQRPEKPSWVVFLHRQRLTKKADRYGMNILPAIPAQLRLRRISGGESTKRQNGVE